MIRPESIRIVAVLLCCIRWLGWAAGTSAILAESVPKALAAGEPKDAPDRSLTAPPGNDSHRAGLWAEYRTLVPGSAAPPLMQIDAKPAFYWGDSSPHPRLPPGPFRVVWKGLLVLKETGAIRFSAFVGGELRLLVDGVEVLAVRETNAERRVDSTKVQKPEPGAYRLEIDYRSLPGVPARLQVWWEGESFSPEPLPASQLRHTPDEIPVPFGMQQRIEEGRELARQWGCARCHVQAFPSAAAAPPGPSLEDLPTRVRRAWLSSWLENPTRLRSQARMPRLFSPDRRGFVEISLVTDYMLRGAAVGTPNATKAKGDHRAGRQGFLGLGCATCHILPDQSEGLSAKAGVGEDSTVDRARRFHFEGLADRFTAEQLAAFIADPRGRYPDGRMPRLPVSAAQARDIAAFLLLWSQPASPMKNENAPPDADEIKAIAERLGAQNNLEAIGAALVKEKGCANCHSGLGEIQSASVPLRLEELAKMVNVGCLNERGRPYFTMPASAMEKIAGYASMAAAEQYASPFHERQQLLKDSACFLCHQGDGDEPPLVELVGQSLWTPHLMRLPYQRTPRLACAAAKYTRAYLAEALRDGVSGNRPTWYSYRMPAYGEHAEKLVQALAERDGEPPSGSLSESQKETENPTLSTLGAGLLGFEGYSCVSCHIWNGRELTSVDPGAVGPELTTVTRRIRRAWFDRWLENPARLHPGTPMPTFFAKGQPAPIASVLHGETSQQIDAIWAYLLLGTNAPSPQPRALIPVLLPQAGEPPVVAQIPIRLANGETLESLCLQYGSHDLVVYDLAKATAHSVRIGSQILRNPNGWRSFSFSETTSVFDLGAAPAFQLLDAGGTPSSAAIEFRGYDRLADGARIRFRILSKTNTIEIAETVRMPSPARERRLRREWQVTGLPKRHSLRIKSGIAPGGSGDKSLAEILNAINGTNLPGHADATAERNTLIIHAIPDDKTGSWTAGLTYQLPAASRSKIAPPPAFDVSAAMKTTDSEIAGGLQRPGYRAIRFPMPKTAAGEDRLMPSSLAVDPRTGRLFIASLKLGELFVLNDPTGDGRDATFSDYAHGLFQEAYSMLHDGEALYVLHRRNLTCIEDGDGDGAADRFDRVAALPHRAGNSYDWAYGLVRDGNGEFILSLAPHSDNRNMPGMGGVLRLAVNDGQANFVEIAFGLRNAFGWTAGPEGQVFFSDNQGEWVAANKLGHLVENRYYGYPNSARPEIAGHPHGNTAVWVPYAWAKSINGIAHDATDGKFGPFGGQIFMAELMHGGAIIRANVEKINGAYQGACFPFWGRGLLGPLVLAFDPKGRLFVGGLTQPGWMAQPDRGALYRIDFTGPMPFEIQSIHALPGGFRLKFTKAVSPALARDPASYSIEHYRYEYTGAYGSPELDRISLKIKRIELTNDDKTVDLTTEALIPGRIYSISAGGVRDADGEPLVHPTGVYTLNQVPNASQAAANFGVH